MDMAYIYLVELDHYDKKTVKKTYLIKLYS